MKLTEAQVRALVAVRDGLVMRRYSMDGNSFQGPSSIGAANYWRLLEAKLIEDSRGVGKYPANFKMQLTPSGEAALKKD